VATEQSGGGLWAQSTNAIISNCILTGNSAMREGGGARGGTLNQCKLIGNTARVSSGGGAIYSTLNNCTLTGNHAGFDGGGAGNSTLNQCFVTDNTAIFGGGAIYSTLSQCVLIGNSVSESGGGAIFCTLTSCTLAGNSAGNNGGGSVDGTLKNCIVYFNDAPDHPNHIDLMLDHTCTTPLPPGGVGNITNNPMFIDLAATNLQLSAGSPARDTGNNVNAPAGPDLAGNARIVNGYVDMGAYEFQGSPQGDYDGDGIGNGDERVAGTDFTDEHDVFGVADVTSGGITFDSVTGRVYAVEFNENLLVVPQVWTEFTNGIPGTGSAIMIHDPDDATNRNYRVRVKLP
jgi:predicted outer membrane repeat protein